MKIGNKKIGEGHRKGGVMKTLREYLPPIIIFYTITFAVIGYVEYFEPNNSKQNSIIFILIVTTVSLIIALPLSKLLSDAAKAIH